MLTEKDDQRIESQAKYRYRRVPVGQFYGKVRDFVAGADYATEYERNRAKGLVEAIQKVQKMFYQPGDLMDLFERVDRIFDLALKKYDTD